MSKIIVNTPNAPQWKGLPYPQAIKAGGFLFISGQLGIDLATGKPVEGAREQTRLIFHYIGEILEAAGLGFESIVKTSCFLTNRERDYEAFNEVYRSYLDSAPRFTVEVAGLAPGCFVEIDAMALLEG